jgi:zinc protease
MSAVNNIKSMKNLLIKAVLMIALFVSKQCISQDKHVLRTNFKGDIVLNFFKGVASLVDSDYVVPVPTAVIGELPNKFKYYIVKNNSSPGKVYIKLLLKVGAGDQQPGQLQVAHLLEHVVFRGTKSFPGDSLAQYLRTKGVERGMDFGASAGYNNTEYDLNIPTGDSGLLKNCFLVMRERLNGGLLLTNEGIDAEKRIVQEEALSRMSPERDTQNKLDYGLYASTCYTKVYGYSTQESYDGIAKVTYEEVRQFYKNWYRPDLAGIIVMGDIDANEIEKRIHDFFADIKMPASVKEKEICRIAYNRENRYLLQGHSFEKPLELVVYFKQAGQAKRTYKDFKLAIIGQLYNEMTNSRYGNSSSQTANKGFVGSSSYYEHLFPFGLREISGVKFMSSAATIDNAAAFEHGVKTGLRKMEIVRRYGFKQAELEEAKAQMLRKWNQPELYSRSSYQLRAFRDHFLFDDAVPAPDYHHELIERIVKELTLTEVNESVKGWLNSSYIDVAILYHEKFTGYIPTEQRFRSWMIKVKEEPLKDYVPKPKKVINFNATYKLPAAKPYQKKHIEELGITELKLSNGATVLLKSDLSDRIHFQAISNGGAAVYSKDRYYSALLAGEIVNSAGIGELNATELRSYLEENGYMTINPYVNERDEGLSGSTKEASFEIFLQLVYRFFTRPNRNEQKAKQFIDEKGRSAANARTNMSERLEKLKYFGMTAWWLLADDAWNQIKPKDSYQIYKERFANAGDFTLVVTGVKDVEAAITLLVKYIGALPDFGKREKAIPWTLPEFKGGTKETTYSKGLVAGNDIVNVFYSGKYDYTEKSTMVFHVLSKVLDEVLNQRIREKEGGTYGLNGFNRTVKSSTGIFSELISFQCSNSRREELINALFEEIELLKRNGPSDKVFERAVTGVFNANNISAMGAALWRMYLIDQFKNNLPLTSVLERSSIIKSITAKDIQEAAEKYLSEKFMYLNIEEPAGVRK